MNLNEAIESGLNTNFDEVPTLVESNALMSNLILDMQDSKFRIPAFNALLRMKVLKPDSIVSYIPDLGKTSSSERIIVRDNDDVYYVGISRGSSQFYVITNSEVDFYLFL